MGLVRLVTELVNPVRSPTTPEETAVAPLMIEAAKSEPGILGMLTDGLEELPETGAAVGILKPGPDAGAAVKPGLYKCHHRGINTGWA